VAIGRNVHAASGRTVRRAGIDRTVRRAMIGRIVRRAVTGLTVRPARIVRIARPTVADRSRGAASSAVRPSVISKEKSHAEAWLSEKWIRTLCSA
jgi:hypothetical protein